MGSWSPTAVEGGRSASETFDQNKSLLAGRDS